VNNGIPVVGAPSRAPYTQPRSPNRTEPSRPQTATAVVRRAGADIRIEESDIRRNIRAIQREAQVEPERTLDAVTRNLSRAALGLIQ